MSDRVSDARDWLFLRHGESTANAARRLSGWEDVALTSTGRAQAESAGAELARWPLARVLVSDLSRARDTAELALARWQQTRNESSPDVEIYPELRERHLGEFQGQQLDLLRSTGQTRLLLGWASHPPGGESHADLAARSLPLLAALPPVDGPTLVVAHGGLLRTLLGLLDDVPLDDIGANRVANAKLIHRAIPARRWTELSLQHGSTPCA